MAYPYLFQQQAPQMPQFNYGNNQNGLTWVQGIGGAKSYLVAPNSTATLWDSEAQTIYLKSADASGMPSMKIIDYTIRDAETPKTPLEMNEPNNPAEYVLKSDFDVLRAELDGLKEQMKHVPRQNNRPNQRKGGNL